MARMAGIEPYQAGLFTRFIFWMTRRKISKLAGHERLIEPVQITAHHPRLLRAYGQMEMGQEAANAVPAHLKALADIKAAMLIGCPF